MKKKEERAFGTHMQRRRPPEGWPNTKAPEENPGKGIRKARKKLEERIKAFDAVTSNKKNGMHRPGSLKVR